MIHLGIPTYPLILMGKWLIPIRDLMMNKNRFSKVILGAAVALGSLQQANAVPFAPTDARAMAMGGTGVASARTVHAVQFNPSLLSNAKEEDDFGLLLPQLGGYVSDQDDFIDNAEDFSDADYADDFTTAFNGIETAVSNSTQSFDDVNNAINADDLAALQVANASLASDVATLNTGTADLQLATTNLNSGLASLSGKPLRGGLGGGAGLAIPSKKFSAAISFNNSTSFSGQLDVAQADLNTLTNYTNALSAYTTELDAYAQASNDATAALAAIDAAGGSVTQAQLDALDDAQTALTTAKDNLDAFSYGGVAGEGDQVIFTAGELDPNADTVTLQSEINIIAVAISEAVLSFSREFNFQGRDVAIGLSPKLQRIDVYSYRVGVEDEIEGDDISDFGTDKTSFNLDIGASTKFGKNDDILVGVVAKNLISQSIETVDLDPAKRTKVEVTPQLRAGVAYEAWGWVNLAADLDLMENDPVAFEDSTQFLGLGAEADVLGFMQVRLGFRTNLAASKQEVVSGGLGLSPFGLFHLDLGAYANVSDPANEAGIVFEAGVDW